LSSSLAGRRVLVVEDNQFNRIVLEAMLQHLGIEVDLAVNGHDGVESFQIGQPYDAILVDLHMPGLDGFGCTRAIRALPEGQAVPILAVTANVLSTTAVECLAAGMNAHLVKPIEPERLQRALTHWILGEHPVVQAKAPPLETDPADGLPDDLPGLDRGKAAGWSNGSARALAKLLEHALTHSGDDPAKLSRHIAAGEVDAAAQITHDLMAVAATVGASALVTAARTLNQEIRGNRMNSALAQESANRIGAEFSLLHVTRDMLR
jgi:CheY-like chemotaxis protein/HPt (histidine-containing phosphotransfer) domain-containing protein